jgi:predicted dehydrogenase
MKVGIVGVGFMGTTHAAAWAETPAEIVGFTAET